MDLMEQFEEATKNWESKLQEDKSFFVNLREQIVSDLKPAHAFNLISDAVELVLKQNHPDLSIYSFQLLLDLCRIADTTELNPTLKTKWDDLSNHLIESGDYYRKQFSILERLYFKN